MTGFKLSNESKVRIETMVETNDGFKIAETDLKLRGPGDLTGTKQSGLLDMKIADLAKDGDILVHARNSAAELMRDDPQLVKSDHQCIRRFMEKTAKERIDWTNIS